MITCFWPSIVLGPQDTSLNKANNTPTFKELVFQWVRGDKQELLNTLIKEIKSFLIMTSLWRKVMGKRRTGPGEGGGEGEGLRCPYNRWPWKAAQEA